MASTSSYSFTANNITYKNGDELIISFDGSFNAIKEFTGYTESTSPGQSDNNYYSTNYRWSTDNETWSPWIAMEINPSANWGDGNKKKFSNLSLSDFAELGYSDGPGTIWLEFKYIRVSNLPLPESAQPLAIDEIKLTYELQTPAASDPLDPPAKICPSGDYYKGVRIDCENGLYRIYDVIQPAIELNRELALAASEMFGWNVCYFKTKADPRSKDVILKEYSLYNVSDIKNIRVMVPDNQFPDNKIIFSPFDMQFEEGFEIHIVKEDFERAFGYCVRPEERDYLFFPIENRLYRVESPYLYKDFMRDGVYYKANLVKWQDSQNIVEGGATGASATIMVDDITQTFEAFEPEIQEEITQITKPQQYNTFNIGEWDFVRSEINQSLDIKKHDINNYFTIVAKYAYDLNSIDYDALGVKYKTAVNVPKDKDRVYMFWFRTNRQVFKNIELAPKLVNEYPASSPSYPDGLLYDTLFDGTAGGTAGIKINLQYGDLNTNGQHTGIFKTKGIEVLINGTSYQFNENYLQQWPNQEFPDLLVDADQWDEQKLVDSRKWYGFVLNVSNTHGSVGCNIWEMEYDPTKPAYTQQSTQLKLNFGQSLDYTPQEIKPSSYYKLVGAPVQTTNIRILTELINEENQPLMLNRYTVRDNQYAEMIDNALPPLKMTRESVR